MQKVRNIKSLPVDINAITEGLSSLLLPSQKPMFNQHMYAHIHRICVIYVYAYTCM